jgi:hypothetical protein
MHFQRQYFVLLPLTAALCLLTVSCSESKVSQCNKIIEVANRAVSEAKAITKDGQLSDPKTTLKAADAMEKASKDMEAIKVTDEKLRDYQARFAQVYRDTSKATHEFVAAFEKKDRRGLTVAVEKLQKAATPEKQLVEDINIYCEGKKSQ